MFYTINVCYWINEPRRRSIFNLYIQNNCTGCLSFNRRTFKQIYIVASSSLKTLSLRKNVPVLCRVQLANSGNPVTRHYPAWSDNGRPSSRQLPFDAALAYTSDSQCMRLQHPSIGNVATCW